MVGAGRERDHLAVHSLGRSACFCELQRAASAIDPPPLAHPTGKICNLNSNALDTTTLYKCICPIGEERTGGGGCWGGARGGGGGGDQFPAWRLIGPSIHAAGSKDCNGVCIDPLQQCCPSVGQCLQGRDWLAGGVARTCARLLASASPRPPTPCGNPADPGNGHRLPWRIHGQWRHHPRPILLLYLLLVRVCHW